MSNNIIPLTPELKSWIKAYILARVRVEVLHPIVRGYQAEILKEIKAVNKETGEPITDSEYTYLMDDNQFEIYLQRCDDEAAKRGFEHDPECCPLLEAETIERECKRELCECLLPMIPGYAGIKFSDLIQYVKDEKDEIKRDKLGRSMFLFDSIIELCLKMYVPQMKEELRELIP